MASRTPRPDPTSRRSASGAWSRLRPSIVDPLEVYGLPSKGETRLNDFKTQETYYNKIVERYMGFCGSRSGEQLERQFAALSLSGGDSGAGVANPGREGAVGEEKSSGVRKGGLAGSSKHAAPATARVADGAKPVQGSSRGVDNATRWTKDPRSSSAPTTVANPAEGTTATAPSRELTLILSAMRKLRESIVATRRTDSFAQRAYMFIIRAAILCRAWESYAPALSYLLGIVHRATPLNETELREFVGYRVLHAACRLEDLGAAYQIRAHWGGRLRDRKVGMLLRALVMDDWDLFWRVKAAVDGYQRRLMESAEEGVRVHALKCLGRTYFGADRGYVERCAGMKWDALVKECGVGWRLEGSGGDWVVIRTPKVKGRPEKAAVGEAG